MILHRFETIDSTNDRAKQMAKDGAQSGTVLVAAAQTGGKGRMGRTFQSPPGMGMYLSLILRPECKAAQLLHLTCAAAVAVCDAVEQAAGFRPGIKWTNDLVCGNRKLGGILTELSLIQGTDQVDFAIIGIGINCLQSKADFSPELQDMAMSLSQAAGKTVSPEALTEAMLQSLGKLEHGLLSQKTQYLEIYRRDCVTLGKEISIVRGECVQHALALDIDPDGGLLVRLENGTVETVSSGEVSIRGMYGYV